MYFHCRLYDLTQDDAFISFTYAKNLAAGQGLVFNAGERVEGYTNFLWTVLMALPHLAGLDVVIAAKALGFVSTAGTLIVIWLLSRCFDPRRPPLFNILALILSISNGALAFWTLSGLETPLFILLVTWGSYQYLRELRGVGKNYWVGLIFGLAALTRPEGVLFFGLTVLHRLIRQIRDKTFAPRASLSWLLPFLALVVPHFLFRFIYYGYLLPNTFYAKAGIGNAYLESGLQYTRDFILAYGFGGVYFLAPLALVLAKKNRDWFSYLALMVFGNAIYVIAIGGDSLSENRFYLTTLPLAYVSFQELLYAAACRLSADGLESKRARYWALMSFSLALVVAMAYRNYSYHRAGIVQSRLILESHNNKLKTLAEYLNGQTQSEQPLLATNAIGIPKYYSKARILDVVGLTDTFITHHPQTLPGLSSSQIAHQKYNVGYVMDHRPDYIFFVTGVKPTYLAEKALFLSQRFRKNYYLIYTGQISLYAKKADGNFEEPEQLYPNPDFVEYYTAALNKINRDATSAIELFEKCIAAGPADFAYPYQWIGMLHRNLKQLEAAYAYLERAVAIDSCTVEAYCNLALIDLTRGRALQARQRSQKAIELAPRFPLGQFAHGLALLATNDLDGAISMLTQPISPTPTTTLDLEALYYLGVAYREKGVAEEAQRIWRSVLQINPDHKAARKALGMPAD